MTKYQKLRVAMRYWITGAYRADGKYQVALEAFNFAEERATGFRKDGVTPSFLHQLEIMAYLITLLPSLRNPAETLAAALLHDTVEDSLTPILEIEDRFGLMVSFAVHRLSKVIEGVKVVALEEYFENMLDSQIATVVKGSDRINNQGTMIGVFSKAKQKEYILESETYILPMLKKARRVYPDQEAVYENIKLVLNNQINLIKAMHT